MIMSYKREKRAPVRSLHTLHVIFPRPPRGKQRRNEKDIPNQTLKAYKITESEVKGQRNHEKPKKDPNFATITTTPELYHRMNKQNCQNQHK